MASVFINTLVFLYFMVHAMLLKQKANLGCQQHKRVSKSAPIGKVLISVESGSAIKWLVTILAKVLMALGKVQEATVLVLALPQASCVCDLGTSAFSYQAPVSHL